MAEEVLEQVTDTEIPEDYAAFTKFRDAERVSEAPAAGEEITPPSESAVEAGQILADPETAADPQQADEDDEIPEPEKGTRLSRRMRKLTGTIATLQARLDGFAKESEEEEEVAEEVASSPEVEATAAPAKLARPQLSDFEDTEEKSAWDQYEAAMDAYNDAKIEAALAKQRDDLNLKHAKDSAQADWNKAAARFPDFNEVVRAEVKISAAMESVMRMDPESGTALAYYMGQHPEESERIARLPLAANEQQWGTALARAGMELGVIRAKLAQPGKPVPVKGPPAAPAKPQTKTITTASKPPSQIRGGVAAPAFDVNNEDDAADYKKWNRARDAQLKRK